MIRYRVQDLLDYMIVDRIDPEARREDLGSSDGFLGLSLIVVILAIIPLDHRPNRSPATSEARRKASSRRWAYLIVMAGLLWVKSFCRVQRSTWPDEASTLA